LSKAAMPALYNETAIPMPGNSDDKRKTFATYAIDVRSSCLFSVHRVLKD
jgi:hypothetical protein